MGNPDVKASLPRFGDGGRGGSGSRQLDGSPAILTTRLDAMIDAARKNSLWPFPFGTACCAIEFMSFMMAHYDVSRFGAEVVRFFSGAMRLMSAAHASASAQTSSALMLQYRAF